MPYNVVYKIIDVDTGKFSCGGRRPEWTTRGKIWSLAGHVKSHLRLGNYKNINAEVVAYKLNQVDSKPLKDIL